MAGWGATSASISAPGKRKFLFRNQDLLMPGNSFTKLISTNMPKATVTFLPPDGTPLPSLSLSGGEAFHTADPRITAGPGAPEPPNLVTSSRAYASHTEEGFGNTTLRMVLVRVANSEETANIDPDTGLQQYVGPSVNHALTATAKHFFTGGSIEASFSRADARNRTTGQPVPEAPRLDWDVAGHFDRLPLGLRRLENSSTWAANLLAMDLQECRCAKCAAHCCDRFHEGRASVGANFLLPSGYTGQTLETLALPSETEPFERIVGVPTKPYATLTLTYNFGSPASHR